MPNHIQVGLLSLLNGQTRFVHYQASALCLPAIKNAVNISTNFHGPLEERVPVQSMATGQMAAMQLAMQASHAQATASNFCAKAITYRGAGRFWRLGPVSRCSKARYPLSDAWLKSLLRRKNLATTKSSSVKYSVLLLMSGTYLQHGHVPSADG